MLTIAHLGSPSSYSGQAAAQAWKGARLLSCATFGEVVAQRFALRRAVAGHECPMVASTDQGHKKRVHQMAIGNLVASYAVNLDIFARNLTIGVRARGGPADFAGRVADRVTTVLNFHG